MQYNKAHYAINNLVIILSMAFLISVYFNIKGCYDGNESPNIAVNSQNIAVQDSIIQKANDSLMVLIDSLMSIETTKIKIRIHWNNIHDTITNTPDSSQYFQTKKLCPITNDSLPFKEINYCLVDGKKAIELLEQAEDEINIKGYQIHQMEVISTSKDNLIDSQQKSAEGLQKKIAELKRKSILKNGIFILTTATIGYLAVVK